MEKSKLETISEIKLFYLLKGIKKDYVGDMGLVKVRHLEWIKETSQHRYLGLFRDVPVESIYADGIFKLTDVEDTLSLYIQSLGFAPPFCAHLIQRSY